MRAPEVFGDISVRPVDLPWDLRQITTQVVCTFMLHLWTIRESLSQHFMSISEANYPGSKYTMNFRSMKGPFYMHLKT